VRILFIILLLLTNLSAIATEKLEDISLDKLSKFGVVISHKADSGFRSHQFDLSFGIPKLDSNQCKVSELVTATRLNGGLFSINYLADTMESKSHYSSAIMVAKSDSLSINVSATYQCENSTSVVYIFGDLADIEKHYDKL